MIRPLLDRIVVIPDEVADKTESGIYLPDEAKERPRTGVVISVGPGGVLDDGTRAPMDVEQGDRVLYGKRSGAEVTEGGRDYLILHSGEILGVVS